MNEHLKHLGDSAIKSAKRMHDLYIENIQGLIDGLMIDCIASMDLRDKTLEVKFGYEFESIKYNGVRMTYGVLSDMPRRVWGPEHHRMYVDERDIPEDEWDDALEDYPAKWHEPVEELTALAYTIAVIYHITKDSALAIPSPIKINC
jgi:hypothetical protein